MAEQLINCPSTGPEKAHKISLSAFSIGPSGKRNTRCHECNEKHNRERLKGFNKDNDAARNGPVYKRQWVFREQHEDLTIDEVHKLWEKKTGGPWLTPKQILAQSGTTVVKPPKSKKTWAAVTGEALLELLRKAAAKAKSTAGKRTHTSVVNYYERNSVIRKAVLNRANGICEYCELPARYFKKNREPILEPHHVDLVSQGGADDAWYVAAVHPDCHAAAHRSGIAKEIREKLIAKLTILKQELMPA